MHADSKCPSRKGFYYYGVLGHVIGALFTDNSGGTRVIPVPPREKITKTVGNPSKNTVFSMVSKLSEVLLQMGGRIYPVSTGF